MDNQRKRVYCPHCEEYVSRSLFYQHKQLYYDESQMKWRLRKPDETLEVSFEFSPSFSGNIMATPTSCSELEDPMSLEDVYTTDDDNSQASSLHLDNDIEIDFEADEELWNSDLTATNKIDPRYKKLVSVLLLFFFFWQSLFRVSDNAIGLLLAFVAKFFSVSASCLNSNVLRDLAAAIPNTLHKAKGWIGQLKEGFTRYVVCPSCHSIYSYKDCVRVDTATNKKQSQLCSYVRFPHHVQARMSAPCSRRLLKLMKSCNGSEYLSPFKTYCYKSVVSSLEAILNRPCMPDLCEKWRNRKIVNDKLFDVYDGNIWNYFQYDYNGEAFLAAPYNYLLMLNCDWFQPFKHTQFSVGVLYMAIQNLPRELRFKRENVIVVGILPGPSEPSMNINTYLQPLITDLQDLWKGVTMTIQGKTVKVRAAFSCLACDVPAARKVGGFVSFNGRYGCNRCMKEFKVVRFGDYPDYSGFEKTDWEFRSHAVHVWFAKQHKNAATLEKRKMIEASSGARYTSLYELPYYNAISSCIIDPMHCLFLGIAKHFFKTWLSHGVLREDHFALLQQKVDSMKSPPDIGRIPYKIASKFSGLKADQWKNWTLYYSLVALKGVLPHRDYDCWLLFVKVCSSVCRRQISISELDAIDKNIQEFCEQFCTLYGKSSLAPNMHFAGHISDCIRDHGPVYAFWLYAFERMNGILGSFQTSNHAVTIQLMRKFINMQNASLEHWPEDLKDQFIPLFQSCLKDAGSVLETSASSELETMKPLPPVKEKSFLNCEIEKIESIMHAIYEGASVQVLRLYRTCPAFAFDDTIKLASNMSKYSNCSKIFICNKLYEIIHFLQCYVIVFYDSQQQKTEKHWLVKCSPYMAHPCKPWYGFPTQVWASVLENTFDYFKLEEIDSRVVFTETEVNFGRHIGHDNVLIVTPIPLHINM